MSTEVKREDLTKCPNVDCPNTAQLDAQSMKILEHKISIEMCCPTCNCKIVHQCTYEKSVLTGWVKETQ